MKHSSEELTSFLARQVHLPGPSWSCTMASFAPCLDASVLTKGGSSENKIMSPRDFQPDM